MNIITCAAGSISTTGFIRPIESSVLKDTRKYPETLHKLLEFCVKKNCLKTVKI